MKRTQVAAFALSLLLPASMFAVDSSLLGDLTIKPGDSPLVRAAKQTAAWRMTLKVHASTIIDNDSLRVTSGGHFAQANATAQDLPPVYQAPTAGGSTAAPSGLSAQDRAAIQRRIQGLRNEQGAMGEEADQPWSGTYNEDLVNKRMSEIPGQVNQLQTQLGASASPVYSLTTPAAVGSGLPQATTQSPTVVNPNQPPPPQ